jgi:hypothetical protein
MGKLGKPKSGAKPGKGFQELQHHCPAFRMLTLAHLKNRWQSRRSGS